MVNEHISKDTLIKEIQEVERSIGDLQTLVDLCGLDAMPEDIFERSRADYELAMSRLLIMSRLYTLVSVYSKNFPEDNYDEVRSRVQEVVNRYSTLFVNSVSLMGDALKEIKRKTHTS